MNQHEEVASRILRAAAAAEGTTYSALLGTTLWRRLLSGPDVADVAGAAHAVMFVVFVTAVASLRDYAGWTARRTACAVAAALVPAGALLVTRTRSVPP